MQNTKQNTCFEDKNLHIIEPVLYQIQDYLETLQKPICCIP